MTEEEEDKFLKENPLVFKKFQVKKKLGEGAFGEVYLGQSILTKEYVALKIEPRKIAKPILQNEAFTIFTLAGPGIPAVKSFGKLKNYNVLVEPLLGKSLFDIFAENHKEMPKEDICLIGQQIIDRIQWVHSKYIVHRDIKPDNFLVGREDPNIIYLIDFGLSQQYRSTTTGKHIRFGFTGKLTGTVRFASANALRGGEQSRRDDIESIGYMMVYFMKKRLPWQGVTGTRKMERYLKIYKMKKNTSPEELCKGLPEEMTDYIRYAKQLEFEQEPNYNYLRKCFSKILKRIHTTNDQLVFSWIKLKDIKNLKKPVNPSSRKESPQSRIYRKIKNSLERVRNQSSDSSDSNNSYQKVYSQAQAPNLQKINTNIPESEADQEKEKEKEKKINKKYLKAKEELNTMIANLDTFVDENVVDFDNEVLLRGSKDNFELTQNNNLYDNMNKNKNILNKEQNNNINNGSCSEKNDEMNIFNQNKNIINNNNLNNLSDNNKPKDNTINNNINTTKNNTDIKNPVINIGEKEKKEKEEKEESNLINNKNNNNSVQQDNIKRNIGDILNEIERNNAQNNNKENKKVSSLFGSINNMIFQDLTPNDNNGNINPINSINNNNVENILSNKMKDDSEQNKENNYERKISLKISNLEGKEFTFNEPLDINIKNNLDKNIKEIIPEYEENMLIEEHKGNATSRLSGNKKIINNINAYNNNNIMNIQKNQGNIKSIMQNNSINQKRQIKPNIVKIKNNNNNAMINKNKINHKVQNNNMSNQKQNNIIKLNNEDIHINSKNQNLNNKNLMNFPNDNDINSFEYNSNEQKFEKNQKPKKIIPMNNYNTNIGRRSPMSNRIIKYIEGNNNKSKYNNFTYINNNNNYFTNNEIIDNKKMIYTNLKGLKIEKIQNNTNNNRKINEIKNMQPNNNLENNGGNNITNININIKNNYVQNPSKNNNNMNIINMNMKRYPNMVKNKTEKKLNTNYAANNFNFNQKNNIRNSPKNQNQLQMERNLYNNKLRTNNTNSVDFLSNAIKNNLNIMVNNPNNINNMNINRINQNMNNFEKMKLQTSPDLVYQISNSVKNAYIAGYANQGRNIQNIQMGNMIKPNLNYGMGMTNQIPVKYYSNNNSNNGIRYNTFGNVYNVPQNLNIKNNLNYQYKFNKNNEVNYVQHN